MDCNLNGISTSTGCNEFSVQGINKIWLVVYGDLYDYTYTNDDLGKITGFKATNLPIEYSIVEGSFVENYLYQGSTRYVHRLEVKIGKMDKDKRNELEKVVGNKLTIIFQDYNGKCWITGEDFGHRTTSFNATTGGDYNGYSIVFECRSINQVKEVTCFDSNCFASFNGTELRQSTFAIENASLFDFSGDWEMIADADLLSYSPAQPLDPTDWSTPATLAQDLVEMTNFVGNTNTSISLNYDALNDIAYITFISTDTSYDFLTFNEGVQQISEITITLNLSFVLATLLDGAATTITVVDGDLNTVYTGNVGDSIGTLPDSVYGSVENAFIVVSDLYPDGTTFTATVENASCETNEYTYVSEALSNCTFDSACGYYFGYDYFLDIPKATDFATFRDITIRLDQEHFPIINDPADYTDTFATVEAAIIAALSQSTLIDTATITVSNFAGYIRVYFRTFSTLGVCTAEYATGLNEFITVGATQSSLLNIETFAPTPSTITIKDSSLNTLAGITGAPPTVNSGFVIEDIEDLGDGNIENIGILYTGYPETEVLNITVKTNDCPTSTFPADTAVCYDATGLSINKRYELWKLDMSGETDVNLGSSFGLVYEEPLGIFTIPFSTINDLIGYQNSQEWVDAFHSNLPTLSINGDLPFRILKFTFDAANWVYWLELEVDDDVTISDIEVDDVPTAFNFVDSTDITFVEAAIPTMNPYTQFEWNFNDYYANAQSITQLGEEPITVTELVQQNSYTFEFDSGAGEVILSTDAAPNPTTLTYQFYDAGWSLIGDLSFAGASYSDTPPGDPNDYAYIVVTNANGLWTAITYDHSTQQDTPLTFTTEQNFLNFWGRTDRWYALTPAVFTPSPTVTSALCP